jgi:hypothetical protein
MKSLKDLASLTNPPAAEMENTAPLPAVRRPQSSDPGPAEGVANRLQCACLGKTKTALLSLLQTV